MFGWATSRNNGAGRLESIWTADTSTPKKRVSSSVCSFSQWTGCVADALVEGDYLASSGIVASPPEIQITRTYTEHDVQQMAALIAPEDLPVGIDHATAVLALRGAFASAFIRADKPLRP